MTLAVAGWSSSRAPAAKSGAVDSNLSPVDAVPIVDPVFAKKHLLGPRLVHN